jgi:hypothetical protein
LLIKKVFSILGLEAKKVIKRQRKKQIMVEVSKVNSGIETARPTWKPSSTSRF